MRFDIDFHKIADDGTVDASLRDQIGPLQLFLFPQVGQEVEVGDSSGAWMKAVVKKTSENLLELQVFWDTFSRLSGPNSFDGNSISSTNRVINVSSLHNITFATRRIRPEASSPRVGLVRS